MRDNFHLIKQQVTSLMNQEYPEFEIVLVNYTSFEENSDFNIWLKQYSNLTFISINERSNFNYSKVFPLSVGIKASKYDLILTTHENCYPFDTYWIRTMVKNHANYQNIAGVSDYKVNKLFFNKLIRYEQNSYNARFISYLYNGNPYSVNTKNFMFRKADFLSINNLLNYYKEANDGSVAFNRMVRDKKTTYIFEDCSKIITDSFPTFKEWFYNVSAKFANVKYATFRGKAIKYLNTLLILIFFITSLVTFIIFKGTFIIILPLILVRAAVWFFYKHKALKHLHQFDLLYTFVLFEIILWFLIPIIYFSSLKVRKNLWI